MEMKKESTGKETLSEKTLLLKKEDIIRTASALFLKQGIDSVRMTDIADAAGLGVASLYRYFGTRTKVVIEAGTRLWQDIQKQFDRAFILASYKEKKGIDQVALEVDFLLDFYRKNPDFVHFLDAFDRLMLQEKVPAEELSDYEKSIVSIEDLFLTACKKGIDDGSIRPDLDYRTLYFTVTHSINALAEKIARGPILSADSPSSSDEELRMLRKLILHYLESAG